MMTIKDPDSENKTLSDQYHSESNELVPPALDEKILSMAKSGTKNKTHADVSSKPVKRAWTQWYATAATVIIGVGLVTFIQQKAPEQIVLDNVPPALEMEERLEVEQIASPQKPSLSKPSLETSANDVRSKSTMGQQISMRQREWNASQLPLQEQLKQKSGKVASAPAALAETMLAPPAPLADESLSATLKQQKKDIKKTKESTIAYDVEINSHTLKPAKPGDTVIRNFQIINRGIFADTYIISATSSQGWADLSNFPIPITLQPKEYVDIAITLKVPDTIISSKSDTLTINLKSENDPKLLKGYITILTVSHTSNE